MRIGINARVLSDSTFRGWNRYAVNLIAGLSNLDLELYLYTDRPLDPAQAEKLPSGSRVTIRQSSNMNYLLWEQVWLPRQCAADKLDIFHSPIHFGLPMLTKAKCVLTLHDAIDEIYYASRAKKKTFAQRRCEMLCASARYRADHIVTVSQRSQQDLIRQFRLAPEKISVIYEAADDNFHKLPTSTDLRTAAAKYHLPKNYLFYIGFLESRKNLGFLLRALAQSGQQTVSVAIGGSGSQEERSGLLELAKSLGIGDQVFLLGRVDDHDLPALYSGAEAFVYPSEYEGFGLQLCEAMALGCPVFASNASCMPEILGNGGGLFPLDNPSTLARMISRNHLDSDFRASMVAKARMRSVSFSWAQTARELYSLYQDLGARVRKLAPSIAPAQV